MEEQLQNDLSPNSDTPAPPSPLALELGHHSRPQNVSSITLPTRSTAQMTPSVLSHGLQTNSKKSASSSKTNRLFPAVPSQDLLASQLVNPLAQLSSLQSGKPPPPSVPGQSTMPLSFPSTEARHLLLSFDRPSNFLSCKSHCPNSPTSSMTPSLPGAQDHPTPSLPGQLLKPSPQLRQTNSSSP